MSQRTVNFIAVAIVGLVGLGGLAIYVHGLLNPLPKPQEPHVADFRFTAAPPAPPRQSDAAAGRPAKPAPDQLPPEKVEELQAARQQAALAKAKGADRAAAQADKPRTYDWAKIEQALQVIRDRRGNSPEYWSDLSGSYAELADPATMHAKDFPQLLKMLDQWRVEFPESPTPLVVMGRAYISYAWDARGSGYAFTVSDVGWELYHQRIEEAQHLLEESLKLGVKDGEVYARLVDVAKALSLPDEQAREWVFAGLKADPTYYTIYQAMAENLLPRWGGAPGDIEKFAAELAEKIPGDDGLVAYGLVAFTVQQYEDHLFDGQFDRALLGKSAVALAERYPTSPRLMSFAALATFTSQDHAAAKRIRPLVGNFDVEERIWPSNHTYGMYMNWSAANEIPGGEDDWMMAPRLGCPGVAFAPNNRFLWCADSSGTTPVRLIDLQSHSVRDEVPGPGGSASFFIFDESKKWLVASFSRGPFQGLMVWDAATHEILASHATRTNARFLAINPSAPQIAWVESKDVRVLDVPADEIRSEFTLPNLVHKLTFSDDGTLLAVWMAPRHKICDAATGSVKFELGFDGDKPWQHLLVHEVLAIDKEGRAWVTVTKVTNPPSKRSLVRFSSDGKTFDPLIGELGNYARAFLSPDRRLLAITSALARTPEGRELPTSIDVWDVAAAKKVKHLDGHWNNVEKIAFSSDGKRLASVGEYSDVIKIWSLDDSPTK